jgi:hypothetical protein
VKISVTSCVDGVHPAPREDLGHVLRQPVQDGQRPLGLGPVAQLDADSDAGRVDERDLGEIEHHEAKPAAGLLEGLADVIEDDLGPVGLDDRAHDLRRHHVPLGLDFDGMRLSLCPGVGHGRSR